MANELQIVDETLLSIETKVAINEDVDRIIAAHKNNRQAINRLVFESVAAMSEADEAQAELSSKGFFSRMWGSITGSNSRLQNRINAGRAEAMYASQQTLQKLAEQNLMTFDLITAVNNKLNASLIKIDEEFKNIYEGLARFFKQNRSELARIEVRLEKVERNLNLLNWQNSIEYQEFNGMEYAELDNVSKIVCLVRDFYDITKGEWTTSDLLLLKTAMATIDISPKAKVNYFEAIKTIAYNEALKEHLLNGRGIKSIDDPSYLISMSCLKKLEALDNEEDYIVDTVVEYIGSSGANVERKVVCSDLTNKYLANKACVNINVDVDCYDLILDLLYNIKQAKDEVLLLPNKAEKAVQLYEMGKCYQDGEGVEQDYEKAYQYYKEAADLGNGDGYAGLAWLYGEGKGVEQDYAKNIELDKKGIALGSARAMNDIGILYYNGYGVAQDYGKAMEWYKKAADLGDTRAMNSIGVLYDNGEGVAQDYGKAMEWYKKAADLGNTRAMRNIGILYYSGHGVAQDYGKAMEWYKRAADLGDDAAMYNIGILYYNGYGVAQDYGKAMEWYQKAADLGDSDAMYYIGLLYERGNGVNKNPKEAFVWYQKAYENGCNNSINKVGWCLTNNFGTENDYDRAYLLFKEGAELEIPVCIANLGWCYHWGNGVEKDINVAKQYYQKAADLGDVWSKGQLERYF